MGSNNIGPVLMRKLEEQVKNSKVETTIAAYLKTLDMFGVCGVEKTILFNAVQDWLIGQRLPYDSNKSKKLIWLQGAVSYALEKQFSKN